MNSDRGRSLPSAAPEDAACPGCGSTELTDVLRMTAQPALVGILFDTPDEARAAPSGDIDLSFCHSCGLIHNRAFDGQIARFRPGYEASLAHSPTFVSFVDDLAIRLVARYDLVGRRVLEIGSGGGYFMRRLAGAGIGEGIGIDPALPASGTELVNGSRITWNRAPFEPARYRGPAPDFVACLSVFESIARPAEFLRDLRRMLGSTATPVYFEVFNGAHAFDHQETWSVHYEQCNYFDLTSLTGLFERCGFEILDAGHCYGEDQYVFVEAAPSPAPGNPELEHRPLPDPLRRFAARHRRSVDDWSTRLAALLDAGKRVVLWGSGGKAFSFLNTVPQAAGVSAVVDVNPDRQGRFLPAGGHPVVPPEALVGAPPDVIVITNPLYEPEIRAQVADLGLACELLAA